MERRVCDRLEATTGTWGFGGGAAGHAMVFGCPPSAANEMIETCWGETENATSIKSLFEDEDAVGRLSSELYDNLNN